MGNEQASRVVQAPGIGTNQDELARPPMMRYIIGDEDTELFSEHRTLGVPSGMSLPKHLVRQVFRFCYRSRQRSSEPPKNVTGRILQILYGPKERSAISPPKVNRFGWNLGYCDWAKCWGWTRQILGAIHAVATVWEGDKKFLWGR